MGPYLHRRYDLHRLLVITIHTIAIVHIRRLSNRMVRLPIRLPRFTVLPRTTCQPYQSRSHAP